ncbi:L-lysine 6-transaminase [Saccharopolyspora sp. HNM0983]|uniref:L-lysine-epsilon aminotransferase n=1 Tax=Saccharopolyspora montiporae TaxID=2781240 RepID=A0A929B831_9PSEU|nr:L-lysine 6-transaminase [Saccharopolyspora sp. HNM0983]MBE9373920.1 L-lysine 6-transaminase [Saccharopolyspora sp. HNM0983]
MTAQQETTQSPTGPPVQRGPRPDAVAALRGHVTGDLLDIQVDLDGSEGCRIRDARDGGGYLDLTTYFSSAPLGHGHPALRAPEFEADLLRAARIKPANPDFATAEQARFADTFRRVVGIAELPLLFFIDGGTLAVENALKIAFDWKTKRNAREGTPVTAGRVLHLEHAFHGRSGYALSLTNTDPVKIRDFPKFDWPRIPAPAVEPGQRWEVPDLLPAEQEALSAAEAALRRWGPEIACFVYEPVQGEGGDRHLRPQFLQAVQQLCREHDVLTAADEVQTGALAGRPWAHVELGLEPDLVAFGKRMQVCGVMGGRRVLDVADNAFRETGRISSTWGGSLVDMVRSTRVLETVERDGLFAAAQAAGAVLRGELQAVAADFPDLVRDPRGRGLMCAISFADPAVRDSAVTALRQRHRVLVLPCGPDSLRFRPPLTAEHADLAEAAAALRRTLAELA